MKKTILALFLLSFIPLAFAEAPVVDYSVDVTDNSSASSHANVGSSDGSTSAAQQKNYNQVPSEQEAKAAIEQQASTSSSASMAGQNSQLQTPVDTSNMSVQQRIKRLEQQVNYINNNQANLDDLQQKLQKAQGDLEVQQHKTAQLEKQLNDFYSDLDQRISKTKAVPAASKSKAAVSDVNTSDDVDTSTNAVSKPTKKKGNLSSSAHSTKKTAGANVTDVNVEQSVVVDSNSTDDTISATATSTKNTTGKKDSTNNANGAKNEQQTYQSAFDNLQNKQYDAAAKKLKTYLINYPDGAYSGNAHYWLGEIYFQENSYAKSSTEFDVVVSKYQNSSKVPEAMFKLAYIHDKEGKHVQAQSEYKELKKRFPKSGAAKLADEQLSITNTK